MSADRRAGALRLLDGGKGRAPRSSRPVSAPRVIVSRRLVTGAAVLNNLWIPPKVIHHVNSPLEPSAHRPHTRRRGPRG